MVIKYEIADNFLAAHKDENVFSLKFDPDTASDKEFKSFMTWVYIQQTSDNQMLREKVSTLETENQSLRLKMTTLDQNVNQALEFKDAEIGELKKDQTLLWKEFHRLANLVSKLDDYMPIVDQRLIELERYTRGFNLRFNNIKEPVGNRNQKEDCRALLQSYFSNVGLTDISIENAHRVGPVNKPTTTNPNPSPRPIIARFNNRPDRRLVLNKRAALFRAGVPVFEDLCKLDLEAKRKHAEAMKVFHAQNKKTYFHRGVWFVDGREYKPVPTVVITAAGAGAAAATD